MSEFGPLRWNGLINLVWDSSLSADGIWKVLEWQVDFRMQVSTLSGTSRSTDDAAQSIFPSGGRVLFVLVTVLFFLWGMSNNSTDILVQQFRKSFELSQFSAQLVPAVNFLGYFCIGNSGGPFHEALGLQIGNGVGADLLRRRDGVILARGDQRAYVPFLIVLVAGGCGAFMLETAANPFIAQFGSANTSERRLNFSQSFNLPGAMVA
jgi:FHS family L-fucose permease-like MFS transporter